MRARPVTLARLLSQARAKAGPRGLDFDLTLPELRLIHARSKGCCELTGIPFSNESWGGYRKPFRMSLDRHDPREPYTYTNCRLVCVAANLAMNEWGEEVLRMMLKSMRLKRGTK